MRSKERLPFYSISFSFLVFFLIYRNFWLLVIFCTPVSVGRGTVYLFMYVFSLHLDTCMDCLITGFTNCLMISLEFLTLENNCYAFLSVLWFFSVILLILFSRLMLCTYLLSGTYLLFFYVHVFTPTIIAIFSR